MRGAAGQHGDAERANHKGGVREKDRRAARHATILSKSRRESDRFSRYA
jgi:hypothetical protein